MSDWSAIQAFLSTLPPHAPPSPGCFLTLACLIPLLHRHQAPMPPGCYSVMQTQPAQQQRELPKPRRQQRQQQRRRPTESQQFGHQPLQQLRRRLRAPHAPGTLTTAPHRARRPPPSPPQSRPRPPSPLKAPGRRTVTSWQPYPPRRKQPRRQRGMFMQRRRQRQRRDGGRAFCDAFPLPWQWLEAC